MNSKGHLIISLTKSATRIAGGIAALNKKNNYSISNRNYYC